MSEDPLIYTFIPVVASHESKVREENERVESESASPPSIYNAPPFDVAVQEVNVMEERESVCPDERVAEIAPPFSDEHPLNVTPEIVTSESREANSNTLPFPDCLLIEVNVFLGVSVRYPPLTDINGLLNVE